MHEPVVLGSVAYIPELNKLNNLDITAREVHHGCLDIIHDEG